jgi:hypothetical protein
MSAICLIDTSILLNLLNVPNRNQDITRVTQAFTEYSDLDFTFIIPLVVVLETGNHISQNGNGSQRRESANRFLLTIDKSLKGEVPFRISDFELWNELKLWLVDFPGEVGKNKLPSKPNEGISLTDFSIVKEFESLCNKYPMSEVFIWSLDSDLSHYHRRSH